MRCKLCGYIRRDARLKTDGTVMNIQGKGSEGLTVITVEYEVKNSKISNQRKYKTKKHCY